MQAILVNLSDMWPATITSINSANSPPPPTTSSSVSTSIPYRPFESDSPMDLLDLRPNPFPSPEPPAPPPAALSPPLQILGWPNSPPSEERTSVEPVRIACFKMPSSYN